MLKPIYEDFLRQIIIHSNNIDEYMDSLYAGTIYSEEDINEIIGVLKNSGLLLCMYADNRAWSVKLTFEGKHYFDKGMNNNLDGLRLKELIDKTEKIELLFHKVDSEWSIGDAIYDVPSYQEWVQEIIMLLHKIDNISNDPFIDGTLKKLEEPMNGINDRDSFSEIKGKLKAISKELDKNGNYLPNEMVKKNYLDNKPVKIFISHATEDKEYAKSIVELLNNIGIPKGREKIFCSSLPGYDIKVGNNICDSLYDQFTKNKLHVIFLHSAAYYNSPMSMNEMGAAWILKTNYTSILLPGFQFDAMNGVVNNKEIAIKLDLDEMEIKDKLNQLRDIIRKEFGLPVLEEIIWEQARNTFISKIKDINQLKEKTYLESINDDIELTEKGYYVKKSEQLAGKDIRYCPACYQDYGKLYPFVRGSARRDMFCSKCKAHINY